MLLNCRSLYALKFALVTKLEAMHHLALENMKNLKVTLFSLGPVSCLIYSLYIVDIHLCCCKVTSSSIRSNCKLAVTLQFHLTEKSGWDAKGTGNRFTGSLQNCHFSVRFGSKKARIFASGWWKWAQSASGESLLITPFFPASEYARPTPRKEMKKKRRSWATGNEAGINCNVGCNSYRYRHLMFSPITLFLRQTLVVKYAAGPCKVEKGSW